MLLIVCPYCGKRPEIEFAYGGQAHLARPGQPSQLWRHSRGCGRFFNALRDTTTDHFLAFYKTGEAQPTLLASGAPPTPRESAT